MKSNMKQEQNKLVSSPYLLFLYYFCHSLNSTQIVDYNFLKMTNIEEYSLQFTCHQYICGKSYKKLGMLLKQHRTKRH